MGETAPFWKFSAASYPDLEESIPVDAISNNKTPPSIEKPCNGTLNNVSKVYSKTDALQLFSVFFHASLIISFNNQWIHFLLTLGRHQFAQL